MLIAAGYLIFPSCFVSSGLASERDYNWELTTQPFLRLVITQDSLPVRFACSCGSSGLLYDPSNGPWHGNDTITPESSLLTVFVLFIQFTRLRLWRFGVYFVFLSLSH